MAKDKKNKKNKGQETQNVAKLTTVGSGQESNPYSQPSIANQEATVLSKDIADNSVADVNQATEKASADTRTLSNEQFTKPGEDLNANQNANYAKDGGQYGRVNNKDYGTTLRLAREADAYNAKTRGHIMAIGPSGVQDLGAGYTRPELNTMEQRAADQAMSLDTNQKTLAQQLQAAVNSKDLDTFKQLYQQLYNVVLTDAQASIQMRSMARGAEVSALWANNRQVFDGLFGRWLKGSIATTIYNLTSTNNEFAQYLSNALQGYGADSLTNWLSNQGLQMFMNQYRKDNPGATAFDVEQARNQYMAQMNDLKIGAAESQEINLKRGRGRRRKNRTKVQA